MIPPQHRVKVFWIVASLLLIGSGLVHWHWGTNGIGVFGSYASVVGLIVTFFVSESVRHIRERYAERVTMWVNFEHFKAIHNRFETSGDTQEVRNSAGDLIPLIDALRVPSSDALRVQLVASLRELVGCRTLREVQPVKDRTTPLLRELSQLIRIHRDKDEWSRDHV